MKQLYKILFICAAFSFFCQTSYAKGGPFYRTQYGEKAPTLTYGTKNEVNINPALRDYLIKNKSPRVAVRFINPNKEEAIENIKNKTFNDAYYDYIEEELGKFGFQVVDHKLLAQLENTSGTMDYSVIKKKLNIDLIIEVSWLQFSKDEAEVIEFDAQKMIVQYVKNRKMEWKDVGYISWDGKEFPKIKGTISALYKIVMTSTSAIGGTIRTCAFRDGTTKVSVTAETVFWEGNHPPRSYGWSEFYSKLTPYNHYNYSDTDRVLNQKMPYINGSTNAIPSSYYDRYKPLTNLFCKELSFIKN